VFGDCAFLAFQNRGVPMPISRLRTSDAGEVPLVGEAALHILKELMSRGTIGDGSVEKQ
jgi:hypothetical protein